MPQILDPAIAGWLLVGFSALWVSLGYFLGRKSKELDDYMLAGRKVGLALGSATAMATWVTSNTTLVAPELAYRLGIWGMLGYSLGSVGLLLFAPMAARIRTLMPNGYTSGDFIRLRFGKTAWRIFLLVSLVYSFGWLVSLGAAGGVLIESLSGIPFAIGATTILTICVLYTLLGGLKAVIGTDYAQTIIIVTGVVIVGALTLTVVDLEQVHTRIAETRPKLLDVLMPASVMFLFNNLLFGVGEIFHSNVWWSRAFAFDRGVGFKAYLLAGVLWIPIPIAAGFIALSAPALGLGIPSADHVGPMVAAEVLGTGGAVLLFVVVFSAIASSLDSLLAATSDLVVEDLYRRHLRPSASNQELRRASAVVIVLLGALTWLICILDLATLAQILHLTGALVASTIWPIAAGLYWRKTNPVGAALGMLLGSTSGIVAYYTIGFYTAALVGAAVSMALVLVATQLRPVEFDWDSLKEDHA